MNYMQAASQKTNRPAEIMTMWIMILLWVNEIQWVHHTDTDSSWFLRQYFGGLAAQA